jgi:serine/threonine protein kinase
VTGQAAKTKKVFDGRYEILSIVGRGARSVVYHARHVNTPSSHVALKVLIDQKGKNPSAERLRREALAMVSCRHRYVARLDDFHSVGTLCYLSMEYAPESDLRNFVKKLGGKLTVEQAERFLKQSAEGIAFIHRAGIIHRDIKPENILVMNEKEVRITDFGVALLPGEECSIADLQSGVGTMNYMAPEILEGKPADQRSDLYALGVVFYELLGGRNPFEGAPLAKQIDIRRGESFPLLTELNPEVPGYLSDLLLQCMRYEPDERFSSGDELLTNLLNAKSEQFSGEQKTQRSKPPRPRTNDIHKRPRKLHPQKTKEELEDPFDEFDRLLAEDEALAAQASSAVPQANEENFKEADELFDEPEIAAEQAPQVKQNEFEDELELEPQIGSELEQQPVENDLSESTSAVAAEEEPLSPDQENLEQNDDEYILRPRNQIPSGRRITASEGGLKRYLIWGVITLLALSMIFSGVRGAMLGAARSLAFWTSSGVELPVFEGTTLTFPALPKGVYSGSIQGLFPGRTIPLTLISYGSDSKIAVLLGIEGWSTVMVDSPKENAKSITVASNGIRLELSGEVMNGKITGYFTNKVNGAKGQWSVEPAT